MHVVVFTADTTMSYVHLARDHELSDFSLADAREFSGWVSMAGVGGSLLVSDGEQPSITRYEIADDLSWKGGKQLSFVNYGAADAGFWDHFFLNEHVAYLTLEEASRVVWDPTEMTISAVTEPVSLSPEQDGLRLESGFQRQPWFPSGPVLKPFYYRDEDWFRFSDTSQIVAYDPTTHEESHVIDAPCQALEAATEDEAGNTYFSTWNVSPALYLYGDAPAPCVARVKPDLTLDEEFTTDFLDWTFDRPVLVWRYVRDGKGIGMVLHTEELDADFSAPYDDAVSEEVGLGNHYYLWLFDLENGTAQPIEGIGGSGRQFHWANFDGRTYVFLPYDSWTKTRIYEVDVQSGIATLAADVPGWVYEWLRVR